MLGKSHFYKIVLFLLCPPPLPWWGKHSPPRSISVVFYLHFFLFSFLSISFAAADLGTFRDAMHQVAKVLLRVWIGSPDSLLHQEFKIWADSTKINSFQHVTSSQLQRESEWSNFWSYWDVRCSDALVYTWIMSKYVWYSDHCYNGIIFFLLVFHLRLNQRTDETVVGWLKPCFVITLCQQQHYSSYTLFEVFSFN